MNLSTTYLGLNLANPIVVSAGPMTRNTQQVGKCAEAGAGAVVLKSLFEEQIRSSTSDLAQALAKEETWHAEVSAYMDAQIGMRYGTRDYLKMIQECKAATGIPVIVSINCISSEWWQDFAAEVAAAGADALELNIAIMPHELDADSSEIENRYVKIVRQTRQTVSIPIAIKLAPYFSCLPQMVAKLHRAGADGFVLFNRLYHPSVDIETMQVKLHPEDRYSSPKELSTSLRWISVLADRAAADFAAATGVHSGTDVVRALLVGAKAVQLQTALVKNGLAHIAVLTDFLQTWMQKHGFEAIADFRGRLAQANNPNAQLFGRTQYIEAVAVK